jgi:hypothetical protein
MVKPASQKTGRPSIKKDASQRASGAVFRARCFFVLALQENPVP